MLEYDTNAYLLRPGPPPNNAAAAARTVRPDLQTRRTRSQSPPRASPKLIHRQGRVLPATATAAAAATTAYSAQVTTANGSTPVLEPVRLCIHYSDDVWYDRFLENSRRLLLLARQTPEQDREQELAPVLARKALKYRKLLDKLAAVDLSDPTLDVGALLRVRWCRVRPGSSTVQVPPQGVAHHHQHHHQCAMLTATPCSTPVQDISVNHG